LDFSVSGYTTWIRATETRPQVKLKQLIDDLAVQPGVQVAAATYRLPRRTSEPPSQPILIEGRAGDPVTADYFGITPKYFDALGIPLLRGRAFTEDDRLDTQPVIVINESLAKQFFGGKDPIGKRIGMGGRRNAAISDEDFSKWPIIVGIVGDVKTLAVNARVDPQIYLPYWQWPMQTPVAVVRAQGEPAALAAMLRREVKKTIPNIPVPKIQTMDSILLEVTAQPRFQTWLLSAFGGLAALLAAIGLYGTLAYAVAQRTHEIGIRMALGAQRSRVLSLILKDGMKLVVVGAIIGTILSLASTKVLAHAFFGIEPQASLPIIVVTVLLFAIALCASYLPARRATKINPTEALRCE
jgi:putative ABC transport system permease protein